MSIYFQRLGDIESDRLLLRRIHKSDVQEIYKIYSDEEVARYDWFYPIKSEEEALAIIDNFNEEFKTQKEITWGIELKKTDKLIGICCLGEFECSSRRAEVGYDLVREQWGKGYATEAVRAVVDFGLESMNLNRIEALVTPGNDASIRVLEKAGFMKEGHLRERDFIKGKLEDGIMMSVLKSDKRED